MTISNAEQNYDITSLMIGQEYRIFKKSTLYTHLRISNEKAQQTKTLNSLYARFKYELSHIVSLLASYGSYSDLENQNRIFIQTKINF